MSELASRKLNIGCGKDIRPGFINLDIVKAPGVDVVHNIEYPWHFEPQSFSLIVAHHVLEHCRNLVDVMNEAYRCMQPGGRFSIKVPWWSGEWAHGDPSHVLFFDHNSFSAFSDWFPVYKQLGIHHSWKKVSQTYLHRKKDENSAFLKEMGFSTCQEMSVVLQRPLPS